MADLRVAVSVSGAEDLQRLSNTFAQLRQESQARPTVTRSRRSTQAQERQAQSFGEQAGESFGKNIIAPTLRAPFEMMRSAASTATRAVTSLVGPLGTLATASVAGTATAGAAVVAMVAIAVPLFNLAATMRILRTSFSWAREAADRQTRLLARTKSKFPGVIGDALRAAESRTSEKLNLATALFGEGADALAEQVTRRFTEVRMGKGLRGERDIFARWGINAGAVQTFEQARGGERIDITDWLALFIRKREDLENRQAATREGSGQWRVITQRRAMLADDSLKLFGQKFSTILNTWGTYDLARLRQNLKAAQPLGSVGPGVDADQRARDFNIQLATTQTIFKQLRKGIAGDVQPSLTAMMDQFRVWLLDAELGGRGMGRAFRNLASALAIKAWETMEELVRSVESGEVERFITTIQNEWKPEQTITTLANAVPVVLEMAEIIANITKLLFGAWGPAWLRRRVRGGPYFAPSEAGAEGRGGGYLGGGGAGGGGATGGYLSGGGPGGGAAGGGATFQERFTGAGPTATGGARAPATYGEPPAGTGTVVPGAGPQRVNYFQRMGVDPRSVQRQTIETPYGKVSAHPQAAADASGFFAELHAAGAPINRLGSYNLRRKRWGGGWSSHAYSAAWDIDDKQFLSPAMNSWVKANPEKFQGALQKWNMAQPLPSKDPAHIEWTGPKPVATGGAGEAPRQVAGFTGAAPTPTQAPAAITPTTPGPITTPAPTTGPKAQFSQNTEAILARTSKASGVDLGILRSFVNIESSGRANLTTGRYKGLFQLSEEQFREHGGRGSVYDPEQNAIAAANKIKKEQDWLRSKGHEPSGFNLYMVHQRGRGGFMSHVGGPGEIPAWQAMAGTGEGRQKGAGWAKQTILKNIPAAALRAMGRTYETITNAEFVNWWRGRYQRAAGTTEASQTVAAVTEAATVREQAPVTPAAPPAPVDKIDTQRAVDVSRMPFKAVGGELARHGPEGSWAKLQPEFRQRLAAMASDMPEDIRKEIGVTSGWRSDELQKQLWFAAKDKSKVARPVSMGGRGSRHLRGTAVDLASAMGMSSFGNTKAYQWMMKNKEKYGLEHLGQPNAPGPWEPWHWQVSSRAKAPPAIAAPAAPSEPLTTVAGEPVTPAGRTFEEMRRLGRERIKSRQRAIAKRMEEGGEEQVEKAATGDKDTESARELLARRDEKKKSLTDEPPKKKDALEEGKAAGEAAAKSFKEGIKDTKIPIKSLKEEDTEREKKSEENQKEAA